MLSTCLTAAVRARPVRTVALAWLLLAGWSMAWAQAPGVPLERQVMAAYLYKFAGFVEWPPAGFARPDSPLQIGVAGSDLLAEQLERMVLGRTINGHPLVVRRVARADAVAGLHILFIDRAVERAGMQDMLAAARGQPLLTVTDASDGLAAGCMIGFVLADERLRFDVALKQVGASGLRISARMLSVAHHVQGNS